MLFAGMNGNGMGFPLPVTSVVPNMIAAQADPRVYGEFQGGALPDPTPASFADAYAESEKRAKVIRYLALGVALVGGYLLVRRIFR